MAGDTSGLTVVGGPAHSIGPNRGVKILLTLTSARPEYGGPAVSVVSLANRLQACGHELCLWCPDGSAPAITGANRAFMHQEGSLEEAIASFGRPDLVHDNGMWLPHNHRIAALAKARGIPRVVSPRGMLSPWSRNHKRLKKQAAWHTYQKRDLLSATCLHATSTSEQIDLAALDLNLPIVTVPNGLPDEVWSDAADNIPEAHTPNTMRRAVFLGRVYPVKGLPNLLSAWARVAPPDWQLVIAGPDEANHTAELQRQAAKLGITASVTFAGSCTGSAKWQLLKSAHLFILPSFTESFGMVVAEAMAAGVPVLTTTGTPWSMLQERQMGWWVPPTSEGLAGALQVAVSLDSIELQKMGLRGKQFAQSNFSWAMLTSQYEGMYKFIRDIATSPQRKEI